MKSLLAAIPLALIGALLMVPTAAHADDRTCRGTIRAVSIDGNVRVPAGATCRLLGTRVDGDVKVGRNATLIARGVRVDGNIQGKKQRRVVVAQRGKKVSRVDGNIQLERGRTGLIRRVVVDGDIQLWRNGRFVVRRNVVDGNLQCKGNRPAPKGGQNRVKGDKENQCRRL